MTYLYASTSLRERLRLLAREDFRGPAPQSIRLAKECLGLLDHMETHPQSPPAEVAREDANVNAEMIVLLQAEVTRYRRLIRWLSLPYGRNLPIFHGPDATALADTYQDALAEDDGDPAYWVATQAALETADPDGPHGTPRGLGARGITDGSEVTSWVTLDDNGNTSEEWIKR